MSIAGIWARSPQAARAGLERLLGALPAHALPRVCGSFADANVRLGYVPTSAIAGSASEPVLDSDSNLAITGDVRLDNRAELISALGVSDEDIADNALLLQAYRRWQEDCVDHLLGDFTFVIHDHARKRLFAARDVAGARAFYYAAFGGTFAFASNPRALRALPELPLDLDPRAVIDYLGDFPEDDQSTLLRVVCRLAPGSRLTYEASVARVSSYFDLASVPECRLRNDEEYAEALRAELGRAVRCRLPRSGRCGVMLSGGLDSSMVTALAARESRARISTFSAVFDDLPECDERLYQAPVVRAAGTDHHEVRPLPVGRGADFGTLCRTFGDPSPMGPHWLAWAASEAAVETGMSVVLTGADGDRVVSHGTGRAAELAWQHRWGELVREVRAVPDFSMLRAIRVLVVHAMLPIVPESWRLFLERHDPRRRKVLTNALHLLRPEPVRLAGVAPRLERAMQRPLNTRESHQQILTSSNRGRDVELLDRLGAALGFEFRHPFFDRRVIELCFGFPGEQKRQQGKPRYVLRNAMAGLVPDLVRLRPRDTYFDAALDAWMRPWVRDLLRTPLALENLEPFVDVEALLPALDAARVMPGAGAAAARWPVDVVRRCVILSKWLDSLGAPVAPLL